MKHVLIHGPMACGKTRNKDALAKAFGCRDIEDGVSMRDFMELAVTAKVKTLFLTNEAPAATDFHALARRAEVLLPFDDAMRKAGLPA